MREVTIKRVDTFTTKPFCGNPAGVITEAGGLSTDDMQRIAGEMKMNLVETGFVVSPASEKTSFRVRFFTPNAELDLSGHVTIATCFSLVEDGRIPLDHGLTKVQLQTRAGNIAVEIHFSGNDPSEAPNCHDDNHNTLILNGKNMGRLERIMIHQPVYRYRSSTVPDNEIAEVFGIDENEITRTGLPPVIASYDLDWLIIPVLHKETILNMHPDLIKLGIWNRKYGIKSNHIFSLDTFNTECITYSRHFGPAIGLWEDPASATASAGLGAYLIEYGITRSDSMCMEQGKEVDSLARILVEIDHKGGEVDSVRTGGLAVTSITRKLNVDSGEILTA